MQIPGAAENAHLYQRQCLTGRAAHTAIPCRPNAAQHFKSPGESPAACFKMQLLFCLCILRVLCGLCTIQSSLPSQKNFSVSAASAVCADKERQRHFGSIFSRIPAEQRMCIPQSVFLCHRAKLPMAQKKKPDFLTRLTHRVLRRRNLTSLLLHSPRLSTRKLQTISVPVLLIAGTRDLIKPSHSRWLARQIPTSRLLLMTGGRHTSIFRTPAPYLRAILEFLRRS